MTAVFEREITVLPENNKTNIALPFTVDSAADFMKITYSYSPKQLGECERAKELIEECLLHDTGEFRRDYPDWKEYLPLNNLITLSLDSPEGYRGAAHRQGCRQEHILSADFASVGFLRGEILKGEWTVTLNVHAIVTESCVCSLKIEVGEGEYERI